MTVLGPIAKAFQKDPDFFVRNVFVSNLDGKVDETLGDGER
jgi:hypothetical protein